MQKGNVAFPFFGNRFLPPFFSQLMDEFFDGQAAAEDNDGNRAIISTIDGGQTDNVQSKCDNQMFTKVSK